MLRRGMQITFITVAILILTGCWNRKELNELSITTALGFDKNKDKDGYHVSVQLINPSEIAAKNAGSQRLPVVTLQIGTERTIFESIRELTRSTPRKIYTSHLRILVIGEELAREGIAKVLDGLSRDHEMRTDFYIIVAKNTTANEVLEILTPLEKIPANKLFSSLETTENSWGASSKVDLHQLIFDLVDKGKDPVLAGIRIKGNPRLGHTRANLDSATPPTVLEYQNLAVFRKDKLVGWLNSKESKGYNYIQGNIKSTIVRVSCPDGGNLNVELLKTHHKIKGRIVNGHPEVDVSVRAEGNIGEVECMMKLGTDRSISIIEKKVRAEIKGTMQQAVRKAKKYQSDIFGFGTAIHRANYKVWSQLQDHWEQEFVDLPVHITVRVKIRRTGSVVESFLERMGGS
ncbi:Ger(x)C family spore germination protein [Paenibacillus solisilvae]|uniref:Ger(X)C family spore germination protein n=1 Tax=Paenibacillus solisilvae TaxID=2486751 RepID=A0ABW0VQ37_9BACL